MPALTGKVAIVTGGASGLGLEIGRTFVAEGAVVVSTDINADAGAAAAESCGAEFLSHDVAVEEDWVAVFAQVMARHGCVDILVNNAGIGEGLGAATPDETRWEDWQRVLNVNAGGVFLGCKHALVNMRGNGGAIVNMSSVAALVATPFLTAYGASKAAVLQLTRSIAVYAAKENIRCNSVHPGQIETPMLQGLFRDVAHSNRVSETDVRTEFLQRIPQGVFGTGADIAAAVVFLASDAAKHITGAQLSVDGGMSAHP